MEKIRKLLKKRIYFNFGSKLVKRMKVFLVALLVLSIFVTSTQLHNFFIFAMEKDDIQNIIKDNDSSNVPLDYEIVEMRDLYTKHFKKIDGTFEVAVYDDAIHYLEDGVYKEINNRLDIDNISSEYSNKANSYKLKLPKTISENKKFKFSYDKYDLSWRFIGINPSDIEVIEGEDNKSNNLRIIDNINQTVLYKSIFESVDLEYVLKGNSVKENYILNEYVEDFNVELELSSKDLNLVEQDSNIYFVNNDGDTIFELGNLYMFDSMYEESDLIDFSIEQTKKDTYILKIIPNDEWLKSASYPVVVDPTLEVIGSSSSTLVRDKYFINGSSYNYDNSMLKIGNTSNTQSYYQSVLEFNIADILSKDIVTYAKLELDIYGTSNTCSSCYANVYEVIDEMSYDNINGTTSIYKSDDVLDYAVIKNTSGEITYNFDVTKTVQEWKNRNQSLGLLLLTRDSEISGEYAYFDSTEGSGKKPTLLIGYLDDVGIVDYHTYQNQTVGSNDVGFTNDYTGELTFMHQDYSPVGDGFSFSISHFYNNENRDNNIGYGNGFRINYSESFSGTQHVRGDGSKIAFTGQNLCDTGLSVCLAAEDGSGDILTESTGFYPIYNSVVSTKDGIKKNFYTNDSTKVKNTMYTEEKTGRTVTVKFIYGTERIDDIVDGFGNRADFVYSTNDLLSRIDIYIKDEYGNKKLTKRISYTYNGTQLTSIDHKTYNYKYKYDKQEWNPKSSYDWTLNYYNSGVSYFTTGISTSKTMYYVNGQFQDTDSTSSTMKRVYGATSTERYYAYDKYKYYDKVCFKKYKRDTNIFRSDDYIGTSCYYFDEDYGTSNSGGAYHNKTYYYSSGSYASTFYDTNSDGSRGYQMYLMSGTSSLKSKSMVSNGEYYYNYSSKEDNAVMKYYNGTLPAGWYMTTPYGVDGDYWRDYKISSTSWIDAYGSNQYSSTRYPSAYSTYNKSWTPAWENIGYSYVEEELDLPSLSSNQRWVKSASTSSSSTITDVTHFDYHADGRLNKVRDDFTKNGTENLTDPTKEYTKEVGIEYLYSGDKVATIRKYIIDNNNVTKYVDKVDISYDFRRTTYTDLKGRQSVYTFDGYGHTINVMDTEGNVIYYKYIDIFDVPESEIRNLNYNLNNKVLTISKPQKQLLNTDAYIDQRINLLLNPSFENDLTKWNGSGYTITTTPTSEDTIIKNIIGNKSLKIGGTQQSRKTLSQYISIYGNPGDNFVLGAFVKGIIPSTDNMDKIAKIKITVDEFYWLDSYELTTTETFEFDLNSQDDNWKYNMLEFSPKYNYSGIKFEVIYQNANEVLLDNLQLYRDQLGTNYGYNDDGNVSSVTTKEGTTTYEYDENHPNDIKIITTEQGITTTVEYDTLNNRVKSINDSNNAKLTFSYDSNSSVTGVMIGDNGTDGEWFSNSTSYVASGRFISQTKDEFNNTINFDYNILNGLLNSLKDQDGVITDYEYDASGNLIEVSRVSESQEYIYENRKLSKIVVNGFEYEFIYDEFGNAKEVKVAGQTLMSYDYNEPIVNDGVTFYPNRLDSQTYSNNLTISFKYNSEGQVTDVMYDGVIRYSYKYNQNGELAQLIDLTAPNSIYTQTYHYDKVGRLNSITDSDGNGINYEYDHITGNLDNYQYDIDDFTRTVTFSFNTDSLKGLYDKTIYSANGKTVTKDYIYKSEDNLNRLDKIQLSIGTKYINQSFTYDDSKVINGNASTRVKSISYDFTGNYNYSYSYDAKGNITNITVKRYSTLMEQYDYQYDDLNQLVKEDILVKAYNASYELVILDSNTVIYTYDLNGNIKFKRYYAYDDLDTKTKEIEYIYDSVWKDKLINVKVDNVITVNFATYDGQGNPTNITGLSSDRIDLIPSGTADFILTWEGRQLKRIGINGGVASVGYTYNSQGYRTSKTIGDVKTEYILDGDKVLYESDGTNKIYYTYDIDGSLISFNYNGVEYFYVRNLQGDIVKLLNSNGTVVAEYYYDAWGNILNYSDLNEIAKANPYRYRGYRYDDETGWYYLNSRYYNPEIGRFINADGLIGQPGDILGHNMYAYTQNNPVMYYDPTGEIAITTIILITAIVAGTGAFTYTAVDSYNKTGEVDWLGATVNGFLTFGTVYTMGMFAYESYLMLSLYMAWNPVVGIGAGGLQYLYNTSSNSSNAIQTYYPLNDGFSGKPTTVTLDKGTQLYRYGGVYGNYVTPKGTPGYQVALPYDKIGIQPTTYKVIKSIPGVQAGPAAPWFGQPGGGIQYLLPERILYYIENGFMR